MKTLCVNLTFTLLFGVYNYSIVFSNKKYTTLKNYNENSQRSNDDRKKKLHSQNTIFKIKRKKIQKKIQTERQQKNSVCFLAVCDRPLCHISFEFQVCSLLKKQRIALANKIHFTPQRVTGFPSKDIIMRRIVGVHSRSVPTVGLSCTQTLGVAKLETIFICYASKGRGHEGHQGSG